MPDYNLGTARGKIELDADDVNRSTRKAKDAVDDFTDGLGENEKALNKNEKANKSLYGALVRAGIGLGFVGKMVATIGIPILTSAIGSAIGAIGALAAGAFSLVAALGPLVGLLPAAAAGVSALAQGAAVALLAFSNLEDGFKDSIKAQEKVDKAQTKLNDAIADYGKGSKEAEKAAKKLTDAQREQARVLEGYSPIAAEFILTVLSMKKPFEDLRDAAQERMFPGMISGIKTLTPLIDRFRPALLDTAGVIGDFVAKAANLAASPLFSRRLVAIAEANVGILERLGDVALALAPIVAILTRAGQPLVDRFLELATGAAETASKFMEGVEASGELARFLERTKEVSGIVFNIFRDGIWVLGKLGVVAYDIGLILLQAFESNIQKAREWLSVYENGSRVRDFFESTLEPLSAMGRLFGEIGRVSGRLFEKLTPQFAGVADSLRVNLLPSLENLFSQMDGEFFDSVIKLTASLADFFAVFVLGTPVFGAVLDGFAGVLDAAVGLIDALGPLGPVVLNVLAAFGAYTTLRIAVGALLAFRAALAAVAVPWLPTVGSLIGKLWASISAYGVAGTAALALQSLAGAIAKVALGLKFLILGHPVVAIIAAIAAAAFLAYKNFEPFREAVDKAWQAIQRFWDSFLNFAGSMIDWFSKIPEAVSNFASSVKTFFQELPGKAGEALSNIVSAVSGWIGEMAGKASELGGRFVDTIARFFRELPGKVVGFLAGVISAIATWAGELAAKGAEAGSNFLQAVVDFFVQLPERIAYALGFVLGRVILWSVSLILLAVQTGNNFVNAIVTFFQQLPGRVSSFLSSVTTRAGLWALEMWAKAVETGTRFISAIVSFFQQLPGRVSGFLNAVISRVSSWVSQMISNAQRAASQFVISVVNFMAQLPGRVSGFLNAVIGRVSSWVGQMISNAQRAGFQFVNSVVNGIQSLPGRVGGILSSVIGAVASWAMQMYGKAIQAGSSFVSAVGSALGRLPGLVSGLISRAIGVLSGFASSAFSAAAKVGSAMWSGFQAGLGISSPSFIERAMFALVDNVGDSIGTLGKQVRQIQSLGARLNTMDLGGNIQAMNAGRYSPSMQLAGARGAGVALGGSSRGGESAPTVVQTQPAIGEITIVNPEGETAEDSLQRTVVKLSALGAFG